MGPEPLEAPISEAAGTREPREGSGSFLRGLLPANRRPELGVPVSCSALIHSISQLTSKSYPENLGRGSIGNENPVGSKIQPLHPSPDLETAQHSPWKGVQSSVHILSNTTGASGG